MNDPIEFRVEWDNIFLERPNEGEFRLVLMTQLRVLPSKDQAGTGQSS